MKRNTVIIILSLIMLSIAFNAYAQYRGRWFPRMDELLTVRDAVLQVLERDKLDATRELNYHKGSTELTPLYLTDDGLNYTDKNLIITDIQNDIVATQLAIDSLNQLGN